MAVVEVATAKDDVTRNLALLPPRDARPLFRRMNMCLWEARRRTRSRTERLQHFLALVVAGAQSVAVDCCRARAGAIPRFRFAACRRSSRCAAHRVRCRSSADRVVAGARYSRARMCCRGCPCWFTNPSAGLKFCSICLMPRPPRKPFGVRRAQPDAPGAVVVRRVPSVSALLDPRFAFERPAAGQARVEVSEIGVHQAVVEIGPWVAIGHDEADARLRQYVRCHAPNEHVAGFDAANSSCRIASVPIVPASDAAAELTAVVEIDLLAARAQADAAREEW